MWCSVHSNSPSRWSASHQLHEALHELLVLRRAQRPQRRQRHIDQRQTGPHVELVDGRHQLQRELEHVRLGELARAREAGRRERRHRDRAARRRSPRGRRTARGPHRRRLAASRRAARWTYSRCTSVGLATCSTACSTTSTGTGLPYTSVAASASPPTKPRRLVAADADDGVGRQRRRILAVPLRIEPANALVAAADAWRTCC